MMIPSTFPTSSGEEHGRKCWNGVLSDDIKSGGVERMISLETNRFFNFFFQKCTNYRRHWLSSVEEGISGAMNECRAYFVTLLYEAVASSCIV